MSKIQELIDTLLQSDDLEVLYIEQMLGSVIRDNGVLGLEINYAILHRLMSRAQTGGPMLPLSIGISDQDVVDAIWCDAIEYSTNSRIDLMLLNNTYINEEIEQTLISNINNNYLSYDIDVLQSILVTTDVNSQLFKLAETRLTQELTCEQEI